MTCGQRRAKRRPRRCASLFDAQTFWLVQEELSFDAGAQPALRLESQVGPLRVAFTGSYREVDASSIAFQFDRACVTIAGRTLLSKRLAGKAKTYTFLLAQDGIVVSRSSAGGLTMMIAVSKLAPPPRKIDFLATRL